MSAAAMAPINVNAQAAHAWIQNSFPREKARIGQKPSGAEDRSWLADRGIAEGEWLIMTKPQLEAKMTPHNTLKQRVWAAGMLATIGYRGEMAMKLVGGKHQPVTAADIRRQLNMVATNWLKQAGEPLTDEVKKKLYVQEAHVRRAIAELEEEEQCVRILADGRSTRIRDLPPDQRLGLVEGDILLCFYFRPLPADSQRVRRVLAKILLPPKERRNPRFQQVRKNLQFLHIEDCDPEEVAKDDSLSEQIRVAVENAQTAARVALESDPTVAAKLALIRNKELRNIVLKVSECEPDLEAAPAEPTHSPDAPAKTAETEPPAADTVIVDTVIEVFGAFKPGDPIQQEFEQLPTELQSAAEIIAVAIGEKVAEKQRKGKPIENHGALLKFIRDDFPAWVKKNARDPRVQRVLDKLHEQQEQHRPMTTEEKRAQLDEQELLLNEVTREGFLDGSPPHQRESYRTMQKECLMRVQLLKESLHKGTRLTRHRLYEAALTPADDGGPVQ